MKLKSVSKRKRNVLDNRATAVPPFFNGDEFSVEEEPLQSALQAQKGAAEISTQPRGVAAVLVHIFLSPIHVVAVFALAVVSNP